MHTYCPGGQLLLHSFQPSEAPPQHSSSRHMPHPSGAPVTHLRVDTSYFIPFAAQSASVINSPGGPSGGFCVVTGGLPFWGCGVGPVCLVCCCCAGAPGALRSLAPSAHQARIPPFAVQFEIAAAMASRLDGNPRAEP